MSDPSCVLISTSQFDGFRFVTVVGTPTSKEPALKFSTFASGSGWVWTTQSYRLAGITFHSSAPQQLDNGPLVGRRDAVRPDANDPHPITHTLDGKDRTRDADDVDDNS